jgi:hypothetical protein
MITSFQPWGQPEFAPPATPEHALPPSRHHSEISDHHVVLLVLLLGGGAGLVLHLTSGSGANRGGEVVLARIDDPGADPFTPPAASLPPTNAKFPTIPPQGDGTDMVTQPYPGDQERLYGGTLDNTSCDPAWPPFGIRARGYG